MANLSEKTLALFFTRGLSLETWDKLGMLAREVKLYSALAENFKEVILFTYGTKKDLSYKNLFPNNVKIVSKPKYVPAVLYSLVLPFMQGSVLRGVDVIKTNQMDGSWTAVIAKKLSRVRGRKTRLVVRCGYEWLRFIEQGRGVWWKKVIATVVERFAYRNADHIIITSEDDKNFIAQRFSVPLSKIKVIPNYVDVRTFKPMELEKDQGRVLFLGRFEVPKNLFNLVEAMRGLPAKLVLIGNGSQKKALQEWVATKEVRAEFLGNLPQHVLPSEFNKSQIFVLPSLFEGNPKALLEAMACGVACIGANAPGISSIIRDGENGLLCDSDPGSIHRSIKRILEDEDLRKSIGAGARETILKTFSLEIILENETGLYRDILSI